MMKKPFRYRITFLYCILPDIFCWVIVIGLYCRFLFKGKLYWQNGLWCELPVESWHGTVGGIVGHGGWFAKGRAGKFGIVDTKTEYHEFIHVHQYEVNCLRLWLVFIPMLVLAFINDCFIQFVVFGLIAWGPLGLLMLTVPGWIQAWIRGEEVYRGSIHEVGAYSAAEEYFRKQHGI